MLALLLIGFLVVAGCGVENSRDYRYDTRPTASFAQNKRAVTARYLELAGRIANVDPEWTGSVSQCDPGTLSDAYLGLIVDRVNFYRDLLELSRVELSLGELGRCQEAAVMFSAQMDIDHFPPSTWPCHTTGAAEAAQSSNLSLGNAGPAAIDGQISDAGNNNAEVGHRQCLLRPRLTRIGVGSA